MVSRTGLVRCLQCGLCSVWAGLAFIALTHCRWQAEEELEEQLSHRAIVSPSERNGSWRDPLADQWESKEDVEALNSATGWGVASLRKRRKVLRNCSVRNLEGAAGEREGSRLQTRPRQLYGTSLFGKDGKIICGRRRALDLHWRQVEGNVSGKDGESRDCVN